MTIPAINIINNPNNNPALARDATPATRNKPHKSSSQGIVNAKIFIRKLGSNLYASTELANASGEEIFSILAIIKTQPRKTRIQNVIYGFDAIAFTLIALPASVFFASLPTPHHTDRDW